MSEIQFQPLTCRQCADTQMLGFDFSFAFQPIVDVRRACVVAYEALVRGPGGEPAHSVLGRLTDDNRYRFDQACRVKAVKLATELGVDCDLNINFMPNAVYKPELCIRTTLSAAETYGFPIERIVFEVTEGERIEDRQHLRSIIEYYQHLGFRTAIDDFGAGYAGLNLLAEYQPNYIKLDRELIAGIDDHAIRQSIVRGILQTCGELGVGILAEGIETEAEFAWLRSCGIALFQGYWFARPEFEVLPRVPAKCYEGSIGA